MGCRAVDLRTGPSKGLLAPLLHILLHELLGILLQHLVDLVKERVELLLELLALLGDLSRRLDVGPARPAFPDCPPGAPLTPRRQAVSTGRGPCGRRGAPGPPAGAWRRPAP